MADDGLDEIRARRMAELQQQFAHRDGSQAEREREQEEKQKDMKNSILAQVLDQQARARLNTIALTKPEKAKMVEGMLLQMVQTGQVQSKLGEEQLKGLLESVSSRMQKTTTVKFDRRRAALDSDDDDD